MSIEIQDYLKPGKRNIIFIYILYLCGLIFPILTVLGGLFAYVGQSDKDNFLDSHYIFAFRTFWIGIIGAAISMIGMIIFVGIILYILLFVWFALRSIIALQFLIHDQPHPNPKTFWIK